MICVPARSPSRRASTSYGRPPASRRSSATGRPRCSPSPVHALVVPLAAAERPASPRLPVAPGLLITHAPAAAMAVWRARRGERHRREGTMEILDASNLFAYHRSMLQDARAGRPVPRGDPRGGPARRRGARHRHRDRPAGYFSCQAGARHVYALEAGPIAGLAKESAARTGSRTGSTVVTGDSTGRRCPSRRTCWSPRRCGTSASARAWSGSSRTPAAPAQARRHRRSPPPSTCTWRRSKAATARRPHREPEDRHGLNSLPLRAVRGPIRSTSRASRRPTSSATRPIC